MPLFCVGVFLFILFVFRNKQVKKSIKDQMSTMTSNLFDKDGNTSSNTVNNKRFVTE